MPTRIHGTHVLRHSSVIVIKREMLNTYKWRTRVTKPKRNAEIYQEKKIYDQVCTKRSNMIKSFGSTLGYQKLIRILVLTIQIVCTLVCDICGTGGSNLTSLPIHKIRKVAKVKKMSCVTDSES